MIARQEQMDADLETDITAAYLRMVDGVTEQDRRTAWADMALLVERRSTAAVMRMELERRIYRATK